MAVEARREGSAWPCWPAHLRLSLLVHPVDLAPDEHTDPAFAPALLAVEEVGNEEGES